MNSAWIETLVGGYVRLAKTASRKRAAELTDAEKVALAMAAGCPVESDMGERNGGYFLTLRTVQDIGFTDGPDGLVIAIGPMPTSRKSSLLFP